MSKSRSAVGETVLKFIQEFPNHPSKTIARILADREPVLFPTVELARSSVRYHRGNSGVKHRRFGAVTDARRPNGTQRDSLELLPDPIVELDPWHVERIDFKRALVISDVHIPFHDKSALRIALNYGRKIEADCVIINGDMMDFYACSSFERDPRLRNLERELECGKAFLETLRDIFPKAKIIYETGNHEDRLWRFVWARCPELYGVRGGDGRTMINLRGLLDCDEYNIRVVDGQRPMLAGEHLYILHGHEFKAAFTNPVNPARGLYLKTKASAICGHHHQTSQHSETGIEKTVSCWSTGCLCDLRPSYMPLNKWNSGFCTVELDGSAWSVENKKIINGSVV